MRLFVRAPLTVNATERTLLFDGAQRVPRQKEPDTMTTTTASTTTEVKCPCCGRMVKVVGGWTVRHFVERTNLGGGVIRKLCKGSGKAA